MCFFNVRSTTALLTPLHKTESFLYNLTSHETLSAHGAFNRVSEADLLQLVRQLL